MIFSISTDKRIRGRYITFPMILPILNDYNVWKTEQEGSSVLKKIIPLYKFGNGKIKILAWSQMHGNESTTTKSLLDIFKYFHDQTPDFLQKITLFAIPILNPDGAECYTRVNANGVDLNRDAENLTQPESRFLRSVFDSVQPDFCFNLHDQRSIFSAGNTFNPATISFLAPAGDNLRQITETRRKSMEIISAMNAHLQLFIPNQVGRFDDSFNINCTGDKFTTLGVPTILFEAGHYPEDYEREKTRNYITESIFFALKYIAENSISGDHFKEYFQIPENHKNFCDVLIKNDINPEENLAIFFQETLENGKIIAKPQQIGEGILKNFYGHTTILLSDIYGDKKYHFESIKNDILHIIEEKIIDNVIF